MVWYAFLVMVRVRNVVTLLECAYQTFYVQHSDVNEDLCNRARRAHGLGYSQVLIIRGEVEDTRLVAKGTKKFQGQGQTLSRPRPRIKDTDANVLQKKKFFKNFFQAISNKKGLQKFFSGKKGLQKFFFWRSLLEETKKGLCRFSARFLAFSNEISTVQK